VRYAYKKKFAPHRPCGKKKGSKMCCGDPLHSMKKIQHSQTHMSLILGQLVCFCVQHYEYVNDRMDIRWHNALLSLATPMLAWCSILDVFMDSFIQSVMILELPYISNSIIPNSQEKSRMVLVIKGFPPCDRGS
jgi:hypothetical protein